MSKKLYVGVDLGGTNVRSGLVDRDGNILFRDERKTLAQESAEAPVKQIVDSITAVVKSGGVSFGDICGVGIGSPGPLSSKEGKVLRAGNLPHWFDFPIASIVSERIGGRKVYLQNDANMFAYGEWWMGAGKGKSDFFAMTLGTGIGGGAICNGKLLVGFNDNPAEIGHTTIDYNGPQCWCGQKGCLELYASATGIVRMTKEDLTNEHIQTSLAEYRRNSVGLDANKIYEAAKGGDEFAKSMFDKVGYLLGIGILNALDILNFDTVAIGGGLARAGDFIFNPIRKALSERGFQSFINDVKVVPAQIPDEAAILGSVRWAIEKEEGSC